MPKARKSKPRRRVHRARRKRAAARQPRTTPVRNRTPHGLRIAAIDIGTNSLHMVIVEVTANLSFKILSSDKDLTNLGASALVRHHLSKSAIHHTLSALARYQRIANGLDCDVILAYATSAVRESDNGGEFVELAKNRLRLPIEVISAQEEAHLIYLAVRNALDLSTHSDGKTGPSLIVDIGGGSAEFIVATNERALLLESHKLGASRLTQQFVHSDPLSNKDKNALEKHIKKTLKPTFKKILSHRPRRIIGTSGTMENLAAMCALHHGEEAARHRLLTQMRREDFEDVCKRLMKTSVRQRQAIPGLDPGRAEQIASGALVVSYLFDKLELDQIDVCDRALREGMIIDYMQKHWPKIKLSVQYPDPRRRSVFELGRRCNFDEKHALQVTKIALAIFDQLQRVHRLSPREREWLEYASLLHDIGWHIGHSGHHKHSAYLVKNGDLEGFSPHELDVLANIARYHRKSAPKKSHADFDALDPPSQKIVWKLAGILRIADGLDRGHYGNVRKVKTRTSRTAVNLRIKTQLDPALELWAASRKTDMFEQSFRRRVNISRS